MKMKLVVVALLSLVALASAGDRTRCNTGTRVNVQGFTAFDNSFPSWCDGEQTYCHRFVYTQAIVNEGVGYNLTGEYGQCGYEPLTDCSSILPFLEPIGEVRSCEVSSCNGTDGEACNTFEFDPAPTDCSTDDNDVRLFPGCGLRELLTGVFDCAAPFLYRFPYADPDNCTNNLDQFVQCVGKQAATCLDSNCPSALDGLSGFRSRFSEASFWATTIKSAQQLVYVVSNYTGGAVDLQPIFDGHMCRVNRSLVEATIDNLEANRFDIDALITSLFPTFTCPDAFSRLQSSGFQFLREFYGSRSTDDTYQAFVNSIQRTVDIFEDCNIEVIKESAPELFSYFNITVDADQIATALGIAFEFAPYLPPQPQNEECPVAEGSGYGRIRLNCDRYYNQTSRCARRKAWACNFAEWRFNFLRSWLNEFYKRYSDEDLPTPECGNDALYVKCKDSALCCYDAPKGCRLCYCTEHDYDHSHAEILTSWRHSYNEWNQFFRSYQNLVDSDTCF